MTESNNGPPPPGPPPPTPMEETPMSESTPVTSVTETSVPPPMSTETVVTSAPETVETTPHLKEGKEDPQPPPPPPLPDTSNINILPQEKDKESTEIKTQVVQTKDEFDILTTPPPDPPSPPPTTNTTSSIPKSSSSSARMTTTSSLTTKTATPAASAATPATVPSSQQATAEIKKRKEKKTKGSKKRKAMEEEDKKPVPRKGKKKKDKRHDDKDRSGNPTTTTTSETRKKKKRSAAHAAVQDMMRNFLEEDKYSHQGSIVHLDPQEEEEDDAARTIWAVTSSAVSRKVQLEIQPLRLDRVALATAMRKRMRMELVKPTSGGLLDRPGGGVSGAFGKARGNSVVIEDGGRTPDAFDEDGGLRKKKRKKQKRGKPNLAELDPEHGALVGDSHCTIIRSSTSRDEMDLEGEQGAGCKDDSSIFGQTQGSSHATWVQCDKCKKWRRLRGVVDSKKLPQKWYCSMNRRDPERAKCSAPEEEYDGTQTPESITDQRARKHLRLWVRRLKCNESYEAHRPTLTRTKKKEFDAKAPYEWVRCCNPSCGKWRAILKTMDASAVIEASKNGEWYCVMNTWDEKTASCAAPQENLPAIGCPPWVQQNKDPFDFPSI